MSDQNVIDEEVREPVLSPVERISEMLFGLFMALTFVGAVSAATTGREEVRTMFAGLGIFLIVVTATLPVVLPFILIDDVGMAKNVSRAIALAMLFFGGVALGRHAGYGGWKAGLIMVGLGTGLVVAIMGIGG